MHQRLAAGGEVDHTADGAFGVDEAECLGGYQLIVSFDVFVVIQRGGELGGGIDDVESEGVVEEGLPFAGPGLSHDCATLVVVAGDVLSYGGEAGGELALVL